jgi:hypothetical protein
MKKIQFIVAFIMTLSHYHIFKRINQQSYTLRYIFKKFSVIFFRLIFKNVL